VKVWFLLILLFAFTISGRLQAQDTDDMSSKPFVASAQPPEDIRHWTPKVNQFKLYVNVQRDDEKMTPQIDVLTDKGSWPFVMKRNGDTVYLYIVPPGYEMQERTVIDHLSNAFPLVVWAGTERAVYAFLFDSGKTMVTTLQPASFISLVEVQPLSKYILCWQLQGSGNSAAEVQRILKELGSQAKLIQLKKGFYQGVWLYLKEVNFRNWKANETSTGTMLALELVNPELRDTIRMQLRKLTIAR
jgi:hypothetical protein